MKNFRSCKCAAFTIYAFKRRVGTPLALDVASAPDRTQRSNRYAVRMCLGHERKLYVNSVQRTWLSSWRRIDCGRTRVKEGGRRVVGVLGLETGYKRRETILRERCEVGWTGRDFLAGKWRGLLGTVPCL